MSPNISDIIKDMMYDPDSGSGSVQKQIDDMKDMMSKSVMELASMDKSAKAGPMENSEPIEIRGRKLLVPDGNLNGERSETILFACLYALNSPVIDDIFTRVNAKAHFLCEDGRIEVQDVCPKGEPKVEPLAQEGQPPGKLKRNILIGDPAPAKKESEGHPKLFALLKEGSVKAIAHLVGDTGDGKTPLFRTIPGKEIPWEHEVKPINTDTELIHYANLVSEALFSTKKEVNDSEKT